MCFLAPDVPVRFTTADESLRENLATRRFLTALLVAFAGLAVCLAMAGVYGLAIGFGNVGCRYVPALGKTKVDPLIALRQE